MRSPLTQLLFMPCRKVKGMICRLKFESSTSGSWGLGWKYQLQDGTRAQTGKEEKWSQEQTFSYRGPGVHEWNENRTSVLKCWAKPGLPLPNGLAARKTNASVQG